MLISTSAKFLDSVIAKTVAYIKSIVPLISAQHLITGENNN